MQVRSFVNGVPKEQLTDEQWNQFVEKAITKAINAIGWEFVNKKESKRIDSKNTD